MDVGGAPGRQADPIAGRLPDLRAGPGAVRRENRTFWRLVHPDDEPRVFEAAVAALEGSAPFRLEHRIVRPDGVLRWVLQAAVVEHDGASRPLRMLGICQDITERKQIEEEIRAAVAYNRGLLEASLDPLVIIGPDGSITDVNIATEEMTGSSRPELLGTDFSTYFTEPELAWAGYKQVSGMEPRATFRWKCGTATATSPRCCTTPRSTVIRPEPYSE